MWIHLVNWDVMLRTNKLSLNKQGLQWLPVAIVPKCSWGLRRWTGIGDLPAASLGTPLLGLLQEGSWGLDSPPQSSEPLLPPKRLPWSGVGTSRALSHCSLLRGCLDLGWVLPDPKQELWKPAVGAGVSRGPRDKLSHLTLRNHICCPRACLGCQGTRPVPGCIKNHCFTGW